MNKYLIAFIMLIVFASTLAVAGNRSDGDWVKIASKRVSFKGETDTVTPTGKEKNISKIKIKCTQGTVKIKKIVAHMSDGSSEELKTKGTGVLTKGISSMPMGLPGKDLKLKKLELTYDTVGVRLVTKRANIEVWGKKKE